MDVETLQSNGSPSKMEDCWLIAEQSVLIDANCAWIINDDCDHAYIEI